MPIQDREVRNPQVEKPGEHFHFDPSNGIKNNRRSGQIYFATKKSRSTFSNTRNTKPWVLKPIYSEFKDEADLRAKHTSKVWRQNARESEEDIKRLIKQGEELRVHLQIKLQAQSSTSSTRSASSTKQQQVRKKNKKHHKEDTPETIKASIQKLEIELEYKQSRHDRYYAKKTFQEYLELICKEHKDDADYKGTIEVIAQEFFRWIIPGQPKTRLLLKEVQGEKQLFICTERIEHKPIPIPFRYKHTEPGWLARTWAALRGKPLNIEPKLSEQEIAEKKQKANEAIVKFKNQLYIDYLDDDKENNDKDSNKEEKISGLGGLLTLALYLAELDLNLTNIIIDEYNHLIKLDGEDSLFMLKVDPIEREAESRKLVISDFDLRHLTCIKDFPADRWLWGHNQHPRRNKQGKLLEKREKIRDESIIPPDCCKYPWFQLESHVTLLKISLLPETWFKEFAAHYAEFPSHAEMIAQVMLDRREWLFEEALENKFFLEYLIFAKTENDEYHVLKEMHDFLAYQSKFETQNSRLIIDAVYQSSRSRRDDQGKKFPTCDQASLDKAEVDMGNQLNLLHQKAQMALIKIYERERKDKEDKEKLRLETLRLETEKKIRNSVLSKLRRKGGFKGLVLGLVVISIFIVANVFTAGLPIMSAGIVCGLVFIASLLAGVLRETRSKKLQKMINAMKANALSEEESEQERLNNPLENFLREDNAKIAKVKNAPLPYDKNRRLAGFKQEQIPTQNNDQMTETNIVKDSNAALVDAESNNTSQRGVIPLVDSGDQVTQTAMSPVKPIQRQLLPEFDNLSKEPDHSPPVSDSSNSSRQQQLSFNRMHTFPGLNSASPRPRQSLPYQNSVAVIHEQLKTNASVDMEKENEALKVVPVSDKLREKAHSLDSFSPSSMRLCQVTPSNDVNPDDDIWESHSTASTASPSPTLSAQHRVLTTDNSSLTNSVSSLTTATAAEEIFSLNKSVISSPVSFRSLLDLNLGGKNPFSLFNLKDPPVGDIQNTRKVEVQQPKKSKTPDQKGHVRSRSG